MWNFFDNQYWFSSPLLAWLRSRYESESNTLGNEDDIMYGDFDGFVFCYEDMRSGLFIEKVILTTFWDFLSDIRQWNSLSIYVKMREVVCQEVILERRLQNG